MAKIFLHPSLPNYFVEESLVTIKDTPRSFVSDYEDAKVVLFPNINLDINFEFWAKLVIEEDKKFTKLSINIDENNMCFESYISKQLIKIGINASIIEKLTENMAGILSKIIPIYRKIFGDYRFSRERVVWRLNPIMAENMHIDCYKTPMANHFARMFINLDDYPRIWHTSWTINEIKNLTFGKISKNDIENLPLNDLWTKMNTVIFGKNSKEWWDDQPRHIVYFDPGDVWIVDSRQVSHQIFYGRRAVSIDFFVEVDDMLDPNKHYLQIAENFRKNTHLEA